MKPFSLVGVDGNAFNVMGYTSSAMRKAGLTAANAYLATYGVPIVPEDVKEAIAESSVKALSKANKLLQKQLKKTSKAYKKRHEKDGQENV